MKRIVALIMAVVISVFITACNSNNKKQSAAEQYRNVAQQYIDKGDMETAKKALEEGIAITNDEGLKKMLEEISNTETVEEIADAETVEKSEVVAVEEVAEPTEVPDYTNYIGTWSSRGFSWEDGGFTMTVSIEGEYMYIACDEVQSAPMNRIAHFEDKIPVSDIVNSKASVVFADDCWGNSGTAVFEFASGQDYYILCTIQDVVYSDFGAWGFSEGDCILYKN